MTAQARARLWATLQNDIRLQARHGFYIAYLVVSIVYAAVLRAVSEPTQQVILPLLLFTDPALLGFFFIGGLLLLERGDRTLEALFVTPLHTREYLLSKVLSLTLLALVSSLGVAVASGARFSPLLLSAGILLTSPLFVLIGVIAASRTSTVNNYVLTAVLYVSPLMVPFIDYFGFASSPLWMVIPTGACLRLFRGTFTDVPAWALAASVVVLVVWNVVAYLWAHRWFERYVIGRVEMKPS